MKARTPSLLPCAALLLAGCSSVQTTVSYPSANARLGERPVASVVVENNGYYLLGLFPVFTGDVARRRRTVFFRDTVTLENNVRLIEEEAKAHGDVVIDEPVTVGGDYAIPYTLWLLSRRTLSTGANIYARDAADAAPAANAPADTAAANTNAPAGRLTGAAECE